MRGKQNESNTKGIADIIFTYRLHLRTMTIMIAPKIADIIETIINVKAHPNSPAVSAMK